MNVIVIRQFLKQFSPVIITLVVALLFALWQHQRSVNVVTNTLLTEQKQAAQVLQASVDALTFRITSTTETNANIVKETQALTQRFDAVSDGFSRLEERVRQDPSIDPPVPDPDATYPHEIDLAWQAYHLAIGD